MSSHKLVPFTFDLLIMSLTGKKPVFQQMLYLLSTFLQPKPSRPKTGSDSPPLRHGQEVHGTGVHAAVVTAVGLGSLHCRICAARF